MVCFLYHACCNERGGLRVDGCMLSVAICDDEPYFLAELQAGVRRYLSDRGLEGEIQAFSTGEDLLDAERAFDLVLMDVRLPGMGGGEVVARLRAAHRHCQVIFVSSYQEYALQAFDLDAVHYCLKPVSDQQLDRALDKAVRAARHSDDAALTIAKGSETQRVALGDILYCEAIDHKIFIHTAQASHDYFGTLDHLQQRLDDRFFRCHKSYLVNVTAVVSKGRDMAMLSDGSRVLVSRRRQQAFTQRLLTAFRREVL